VVFLGIYAQELPLSLYPTLQDPTTTDGVHYQLGGRLFSTVALLTLAVAFSVAILRYRLYNIDVIIHRTLVYLPVTALVAGLLAASIKLTEKLLLSEQQSLVATTLTTLVVATAFTPIRTSTQKIVDKHFKEVPNGSKQVKEFGKQVRSRLFAVDPQEITRRLLEEAVTGFEAESGAIHLESSRGTRPMHRTRGWNDVGVLTVPLQDAPDGEKLGVLMLGARRTGSEYTTRDQSALEEAAREVALAIKEDQKRQVPIKQDASMRWRTGWRSKRQR
jgi:hypothetical protein